MESISAADARQIIRILGDISGMTTPLEERRRELLQRLGKFIDADIWIWVNSQINSKNDIAAFSMVDGGYVDHIERGKLLAAMNNPEFNALFLNKVFQPDVHFTTITADVHRAVNDQEVLLVNQVYAEAGISNSVISIYPLANQSLSAIGLHRRSNRPEFSERERFLAHLVISQIDWLHHTNLQPSANNDKLFELSNRQRQTLLLLLQGRSAKQIAQIMQISLNTVQDHIKEIYRKHHVSGRNELLSLFVAGGKRIEM